MNSTRIQIQRPVKCAECFDSGRVLTTVVEHHFTRNGKGLEQRKARAVKHLVPCSCTGPADEVDEMAAKLERLVRRLAKASDTHSLHALDVLLTRIRTSLEDAAQEVSP